MRFPILIIAFLLATIFVCRINAQDAQSYAGPGKSKNATAGNERDFSKENLFTGDVAFSVPVASLSGVNVALGYNSNIHKLMRTDNAIQGAGWVGLGWTLQLGSIVGELNNTADTSDDRYYFISAGNTTELIRASDGNYKLKDYQYWKITRNISGGNTLGWTIVTDDGTIQRYGNYDKSSAAFSFNVSGTKATRFELALGGIIGSASTTTYSSMSLVAYRWDISDIQDIFGNHTTIAYQQQLDTLKSGGYQSIPYTEASYPFSVKDRVGNSIQFIIDTMYQCEYEQGLDKTSQNMFERHYLKAVLVSNASGAVQKEIDLAYDTAAVHGTGQTKRYLASITEKDGNGNSLSPTLFGYYGVKNTPIDSNPGGLKTIQYPSGGSVKYTYAEQQIANATLDSKVRYQSGVEPVAIDPKIPHGLSGRDFYAAEMSDHTLRVYRWGPKGWYFDSTFPFTSAVTNFKVMDDYIVLANSSVLQVCKRKDDGWSLYTVSLSSSGVPDVKEAYPGYFLIVNNITTVNDHPNGDLSVVKWINNQWVVYQAVGNYCLDNLMFSCSQSYFTVSYSYYTGNPFLPLLCAVNVYKWNGSGWTFQNIFGSQNKICPIVVASSVDYFVCFLPNTDDHNNWSIEAYKWDGSSWVNNYYVQGYPLAGRFRNFMVAEKYFLIIDDNTVEGTAYGQDGVVMTWTGSTWASTFIPTLFSAGSVVNGIVSMYTPAFSMYENKLVAVWKGEYSQSNETLAVATLRNGSWDPANTRRIRTTATTNGLVGLVRGGEDFYVQQHGNNFYYFEQNAWQTKLFCANDPGHTIEMPGPDSYCLIGDSATGVSWDRYSHAYKHGFGPYATDPVRYEGVAYDFPVATKIVYSGMGDSLKQVFQFSNGTYDANVDFAKYNKAKVNTPGLNDSTVSYFYNDLGATDAINFVDVPNYNLLDGLQYRTIVYDENENVLSDSKNYWSVVGIDTTYGILHRRMLATMTVQLGMPDSIVYTYSDTNGQVVNTTKYCHAGSNLSGIRDLSTDVRYAYQAYPSMQTANMISQPLSRKISAVAPLTSTGCNAFIDGANANDIERIQFTLVVAQPISWTVQYAGGGGQFKIGTSYDGFDMVDRNGSSGTQIGSFNGTAGTTYYVLSKAISQTTPPWARVNAVVTCNVGSDPTSVLLSNDSTIYSSNLPLYQLRWNGSTWDTTNTVVSRDSYGNILETQNTDGVHTVTKYGYSSSVPTATFTNATDGETFFEDFEEGSSRWVVNNWSSGDTSYERTVSGCAYTGTTSYKIKKSNSVGVVSINTSAYLAASAGTEYLASVMMKGDAISAATAGSEIQFYDINHSQIGDFIKADVGGTFDWTYHEQKATAPANTKYMRVWLRMGSPSLNATVWFDHVRVYPSQATAITQSYDPVTMQQTSATDENSVSAFTEYDSFSRVVRGINDDGIITVEHTSFNSNERNNGTFSKTDPNCSEAASFPNGNHLKNWSFEEAGTGSTPAHWGGSVDGISYQSLFGGRAVRMKAAPGGGYTYLWNTIGNLKAGKKYTASVWFKSASGKKGRLFIGDASAGDAHPYEFSGVDSMTSNGAWQRLVVKSQLLTHDDTISVYLYGLGSGGTGDTVLYDGVIVEDDTLATLPMISTEYSDGLDRTIQSQVRDSVNAVLDIVSAVQYDTAGRSWRQWRPYAFVTGHAYDPSFSTHAQAYYKNLTTNPYTESQYYGDSRGLVHFKKPAGSASTDEYTESLYDTARVDGNLCVTASTISLQGSDMNNWVKRTAYSDVLGRKIRTSVYDYDLGEVETTRTVYTMTGAPVSLTDPRGMKTSYTYDFLGRTISSRTPDAGTSYFLYDKSGRKRLMVDSVGLSSATDSILYWKFDNLGRVTEKGYYGRNWNSVNLAESIKSKTWPNAPMTWRKRYYYDTASTGQYSEGRLSKVLTNNDADSIAEVAEGFSYDKYGNVAIKDMQEIDFSPQTYSTMYTYDVLNREKDVTYPGRTANLTLQGLTLTGSSTSATYEAQIKITAGPSFIVTSGANCTFKAGSAIDLRSGFKSASGGYFHGYINADQAVKVSYVYNQRGNVSRIGNPMNSAYYATYTYNAEGQIDTEFTNNNTLFTVHDFKDTRGRLRNIKTVLSGNPTTLMFSDSLTYASQGYNFVGFFTSVASDSFRYGSGGPSGYKYRYSYDNQGRMTVAQNTNTSAGNIGVGTGNQISYDPNGNYVQFLMGASTLKQYSYFPNSNKVKNTNGGGGSDYSYDENGNCISSVPKQITSMTYDRFTQLTTGVTLNSGDKLSYGYNGNKQRVLETYKHGSVVTSTLYLHGTNDYPLIEKSNAQLAATDRRYIYGPTGLIAMNSGGVDFYVLKDHLGSSRVILDGRTNTISSTFDYTPLGSLWRSTVTSDIAYKFTGQEHDTQDKLYNYRARVYDDTLGRFYAVDPAHQGFGPYNYAGNNPIINVDRDGRFFWVVFGMWAYTLEQAHEHKIHSFWGFIGALGKGAASSALTAEASGAFAELAGGAGLSQGLSEIGNGVFTSAFQGGVQSQWDNGDFDAGFRSGLMSGAVSTSFSMASQLRQLGPVANITGNGLVQGWISKVNGGNFWNGFLNGSISGVGSAFGSDEATYMSSQSSKDAERVAGITSEDEAKMQYGPGSGTGIVKTTKLSLNSSQTNDLSELHAKLMKQLPPGSDVAFLSTFDNAHPSQRFGRTHVQTDSEEGSPYGSMHHDWYPLVTHPLFHLLVDQLYQNWICEGNPSGK